MNVQVEVQIVSKLNKIPIWRREGDVTKNCTQEILANDLIMVGFMGHTVNSVNR
jgi:hypothetical protein